MMCKDLENSIKLIQEKIKEIELKIECLIERVEYIENKLYE